MVLCLPEWQNLLAAEIEVIVDLDHHFARNPISDQCQDIAVSYRTKRWPPEG